MISRGHRANYSDSEEAGLIRRGYVSRNQPTSGPARRFIFRTPVRRLSVKYNQTVECIFACIILRCVIGERRGGCKIEASSTGRCLVSREFSREYIDRAARHTFQRAFFSTLAVIRRGSRFLETFRNTLTVTHFVTAKRYKIALSYRGWRAVRGNLILRLNLTTA